MDLRREEDFLAKESLSRCMPPHGGETYMISDWGSRHPNRRRWPCVSVRENLAHYCYLSTDVETKTSDR